MPNVCFPQPQGDRITGSEFARQLLSSDGLDRFKRELLIEKWIADGALPPFLANFKKIDLPVGKSGDVLSIYVAPDCLCVGTNDDYIRTPLFPTTAQRILDSIGCVLPAFHLVDLIWKHADVRLNSHDLTWGEPYDASMMSSYRIVEHNRRINEKLPTDFTPGQLIVGHKKDVVLCNELKTLVDKVAIYGWHDMSGHAIQGLYLGHDANYADYAHSIRAIMRFATLTRKTGEVETVDMKNVYTDKYLSQAVSAVGPLSLWRQPKVLPIPE
jgi:hypothetical protein